MRERTHTFVEATLIAGLWWAIGTTALVIKGEGAIEEAPAWVVKSWLKIALLNSGLDTAETNLDSGWLEGKELVEIPGGLLGDETAEDEEGKVEGKEVNTGGKIGATAGTEVVGTTGIGIEVGGVAGILAAAAAAAYRIGGKAGAGVVLGKVGAGPETDRVGVAITGLGVAESIVNFLGNEAGGLDFVTFGLLTFSIDESVVEGAGIILGSVIGGSFTGVFGRYAGATIGVGGTEEISSAIEAESWADWISSPPKLNASSSSLRFRSS